MSNNKHTLDYILNRYDISKDEKSPVYLGRSRWASLTKLFKELNFTVGAEVGVERGRFSKIICQNNPQLKLYVIDCWQTYEGYRDHVSQQRLDEFYLETKTRLKPFNCHFIRDWSTNAVKRFADESLDFVFIDASHDYEFVKEDIGQWSKKVKVGGLVSGHDYIDKLHGITYGVKLAVNEWVEENSMRPLFIFDKDSCPTWMYVKEKNNRKGITKGILYYTDNRIDPNIMKMCQEQLAKSNLPITSVSLAPINFGKNIVFPAERGYLTMARQIVKGLEDMTEDIIFFAEHDVLYHPSHFDFTPTKKDVFYYNMNSWMLRESDGHCLYYDHRSLSGMCCFRQTALGHFKKRKERIEALLAEAGDTGKVQATSGNTISLKESIHRLGFEPGTHDRPEKIDDLKAESWRSEFPNVDIKHSNNLTQNRFRKDQFRNARSYQGWQEADVIPGWGKVNI